jgi:autotransporter-associated beta strand protein
MELIAPPYIEIFDFNGEGDGATAYAELDTSTRRVSRVIVTSPGWDYSAPKAVFKLGGTVVCTNDCAVAPAVGGGFTKTGEGTYLLAATNTYSGATVVKGGTLKIKFAEALPSNTVVSLQGGTLDLNGCTVPVAKVIGDGGSIVNGSVSMEGLEYDIAAGECVTYGCPVAFAPGAAVKLLNADSLDKDRRYVIAHFRGGVQNVPLAFVGLSEEVAAEWKLMLSGGFLKLYRPRGSVVVFR